MVALAEIFSKGCDVTTEEIDLWIEYLGPVWRGPMSWMKTGLIRWNEALRERGIESYATDQEFETFVRGRQPEGHSVES